MNSKTPRQQDSKDDTSRRDEANTWGWGTISSLSLDARNTHARGQAVATRLKQVHAGISERAQMRCAEDLSGRTARAGPRKGDCVRGESERGAH